MSAERITDFLGCDVMRAAATPARVCVAPLGAVNRVTATSVAGTPLPEHELLIRYSIELRYQTRRINLLRRELALAQQKIRRLEGEARSVNDTRADKPGEATSSAAMKYRTIVADPPWRYREAGVTKADSRKFYPTMSVGEICQLRRLHLAPVRRRCPPVAVDDERAHRRGPRRSPRMGFRPLTLITWCKNRPGVGHYLRNNTEHVILASRGLPMTPEHKPISTWYEWPSAEHSRKPDAFFDLVEQVSPGPYLELFARRNRFGWDTWGNEALCHVEMVTSSAYEKLPTGNLVAQQTAVACALQNNAARKKILAELKDTDFLDPEVSQADRRHAEAQRPGQDQRIERAPGAVRGRPGAPLRRRARDERAGCGRERRLAGGDRWRQGGRRRVGSCAPLWAPST